MTEVYTTMFRRIEVTTHEPFHAHSHTPSKVEVKLNCQAYKPRTHSYKGLILTVDSTSKSEQICLSDRSHREFNSLGQ